MRYELYLPPGHGQGDGLPYLVFLPGYKDSETFCRTKGFFEITEAEILGKHVPPMAVVCVGRGRGLWIDLYDEHLHYETALIKDLIDRLVSTHGFGTNAGQRGLLGISLGGYAALKISLKYPDLFGSVSALSPALDPLYEERVRARKLPWGRGGERARRAMYGPSFDEDRALREDPYYLVEHLEAGPLPVYYLTCGSEDRHGLAEPLVQFRRLLEAHAARVSGAILKGNHDPSFWRGVYPLALAVHARRFGDHPPTPTEGGRPLDRTGNR